MAKSMQELESLVQTQQSQLTRYETRLKDVVTAYKGLLKEKEAIEASLSVFTGKKNDDTHKNETKQSGSQSLPSTAENDSKISAKDTLDKSDGTAELQMQIATVMNSLATLSAEKSKMEASFQADKKSMRNELKIREKTIFDCKEKLNAADAQTKLEVEKVKSKLIIERHEWEKESNNQMSMVRELQKLLADQRQLKENLEMQLNDLKLQFSNSGHSDGRISELMGELDLTKKKLKECQNVKKSERNSPSSENVSKQLQSEMVHLKKQHAIAIQFEQQRAQRAEERNKSLCAMHEERVASLESRLAELSTTVGSYDRLRQMDQENILNLKEIIAQFDSNIKNELNLQNIDISELKANAPPSTRYTNWNINELINEILLLKNVLLLENSKLETPVDVSKIYSAFSASDMAKPNESCNCTERCDLLLTQNQKYLSENEKLKEIVDVQKTHIKTLQSKVEVLNRNIDEQEDELRNRNQEFKTELRTERTKWKEIISNMEMEFRTKQSELELQLQKQRERSLSLLEEKENEIKALRTSFDVFAIPNKSVVRHHTDPNDQNDEKLSRRKKLSSSSSSHMSNVLPESDDDLNTISANCSIQGTSSKEPMHMLHYVHELSRKEVEISALRKSKHLAEQTLRQALQDKATAQEDLYDKISNLEEQVDRLERCKSREGANLEYLKNVIVSFLQTNDVDGRRHMVNAIGAVLEFSPNELKTINNYFNKKERK